MIYEGKSEDHFYFPKESSNHQHITDSLHTYCLIYMGHMPDTIMK